MGINWGRGPIDGVIINKLEKHLDKRGSLTETFRIDELPNSLQPKMSYVSFTEPRVFRGPHEHKHQTDIFSFIGPGNFIIKLWDNRVKKKTYGNYMELFVGADNPVTLIVPPGVVHGYKNISKTEQAMAINYPDHLYKGWGRQENVDEIRYEDLDEPDFKMED